MSTRTHHRVHCEAPNCDASAPASNIPAGWRRIYSSDHIPNDPPFQRRSRNKLTASERLAGAFALDLCPDHHEFFDGHHPRTDGRPGGRGRDSMAQVSCECGVNGGYVTCGTLVAGGRSEGPRRITERAWWQHLPAELQAYHHEPKARP